MVVVYVVSGVGVIVVAILVSKVDVMEFGVIEVVDDGMIV